MINEPITVERIDELLAFLPGFEDPGRKYIERWTGGKTANRPYGRPRQGGVLPPRRTAVLV